MRILRVIASVDQAAGGPLVAITESIGAFSALGHDTDILCLEPYGTPIDIPGARVFALGPLQRANKRRTRLPSLIGYRYSRRVVPWLREHAADYDAVIVDGLWNYTSLAVRTALRHSDTPYFVFTHGMLDPWFNRAFPMKTVFKRAHWRLLEHKVLADAAGVLFTAEDERDLARTAYQPYCAVERVVGLGITDAPPRTPAMDRARHGAIPTLGSRPYLLFLSRIQQKKGCDILIDAFADVIGPAGGIDLVIAGPDETGWRADLEAQAERRGVEACIHWPGMISGDAKWGALYGCEAFVLASHSENFGIAVTEAMACARPVLTTDKVNIWRPIAQGGGLVADDTVAGFGGILSRFAAMSRDERTAMGVAARQTFLRDFDVRAMCERLTRLIEQERDARRDRRAPAGQSTITAPRARP